jgi:aminomethyltransferase
VDTKSDRDFCGRAAVLDREARFQMLGIVLSDKGMLRAHQNVRCESGTGLVTSGSYSPTLERSIGFARVPRSASIGETVEVTVRDKPLRAVLTRARFVRNGKSLL